MAIKQLFVHCSDSPWHVDGKPVNAAMIDDWHRAKGWDGIGYHFVILPDGEVEAGRNINVTPAAQKGHNKDTIAYCLVGKDAFTVPQLVSLKRKLLADLRFYGLHVTDIWVHNEVNRNKTCPNFNVHDLLYLML